MYVFLLDMKPIYFYFKMAIKMHIPHFLILTLTFDRLL